jgi:hypothetical protein
VTTRFWRLLGHTHVGTPPARGRLSATFRHDDDVMVDTINVCPANGMLLRTAARGSGPDGPQPIYGRASSVRFDDDAQAEPPWPVTCVDLLNGAAQVRGR